jgi:hypothetical protein
LQPFWLASDLLFLLFAPFAFLSYSREQEIDLNINKKLPHNQSATAF